MKNIVKQKREELGITQEELSKQANISRPTISQIETHVLDNIESKTMFRIAKALNCDIGDIFFEESVVFTQLKDQSEREE